MIIRLHTPFIDIYLLFDKKKGNLRIILVSRHSFFFPKVFVHVYVCGNLFSFRIFHTSVHPGQCQGIYKLKPNCYEIELEELGTIEDAGRGICRRDDSLCTARMESILRDFLQTFG